MTSPCIIGVATTGPLLTKATSSASSIPVASMETLLV